MESEGAPEACFEPPADEPLVAGAEGEELIVGVRPQTPSGRAAGVEPTPAEYGGERGVGPEAPHDPGCVAAEGEPDARDHGRIERFSRYRYAPSRYDPRTEEVVEQDDGGGDRHEVDEADKQERPQPSYGREIGRASCRERV